MSHHSESGYADQFRAIAEEILGDTRKTETLPGDALKAKRELVSATNQYLGWGWSLVPMAGKRPRFAWERYCHEFVHPKALAVQLTSPATTGVAAVCGKLSNLLVIDFDGEAGADAFDSLRDQFPSGTRIARSGSGGYHAYFAHTDGVTTSKFTWSGAAAGEVRGEGALIVLPPVNTPAEVPTSGSPDLARRPPERS